MQKKWSDIKFGEAQKCTFQMGLIDEVLFKQIEMVRIERNSFVHLFWFFNHKIDENITIEKIHNRLKIVLELSRIFEKMEPWTYDKAIFDIRSFTKLQNYNKENAIQCKFLKDFK